MEGQEVVNETPAEQTVETESTPVEEATAAGDSQQATETSDDTPVGESTDSDKVSKTVPYDRFKKYVDKYNDLESKVSEIISRDSQAQGSQYVPELEEEAAAAVRQEAQRIYEQQKQIEFEAKHAKDLDDKLVRAAFMVEVNELMAKGKYVDREAALQNAKAQLENRLKPAQQKAKEEGVKEGQDIAKTKQQLGAVGDTGKQPEVGDDQLTATELAKKYNLPRYE